MAEKTKKTTKETPAGVNDPDEMTYRAHLKVGEETIATITIRAKTDDEAKKQLEAAKPKAFEGIGKWSLSKMAATEVSLE